MPHLWRDQDVKRLCRLARAEGIDPAVIEVDTRKGIVRVFGPTNKKTGALATKLAASRQVIEA
jgi:hypothetical protein